MLKASKWYKWGNFDDKLKQNQPISWTILQMRQIMLQNICFELLIWISISGSLIETIRAPFGNIVSDIFFYHVAVASIPYNMVMIATLPSEIYIVSASIKTYRPFNSSYYDRQCRALCRDARFVRPRCVWVLGGYADNRMNMIRHHNKNRNLSIVVMEVYISELLLTIHSDLGKMHILTPDFSKVVFFLLGADCYEIYSAGIIMKISSRGLSMW